MDDSSGVDICRVCRSEGQPERPLFHPCICTGSIKWIHQECLVQWMRYSRKEYCELCSHHFSFTPIYSPDMPHRLPLRDVAGGLLSSIATALKYWLHYTLVAFAWLGLVPLIACRIYRSLFSGSFESIITLPFDILKTQNIPSDVLHGCFVITCTLFAFIGMIWLRDQIVHGGGPDWLEPEQGQQPGQQQEQHQQHELAEPENDNVPMQEDAEVPPVEFNNNNNINSNINNNNNDDNINYNNNNNNDNNRHPNSNGNIDLLHHEDSHDNSETDHIVHDEILVDAAAATPTTSTNDLISISDNVNINSESKAGNCDPKVMEANASSTQQAETASESGFNNSEWNSNDGNTDFRDSNFQTNGVRSDSYNDYIDDMYFGAQDEHLEDPDNDFGPIQNENEEVEENNEVMVEGNQDEGMDDLGVAEGEENAQDDGNWNPIEWDRAVEELTWERLLGLDGSLVFLEHVFWVMALNTLVILLFAYLPYHCGNFAISGLGLKEKTAGTHFEGLITTLCGYCIIGLCLVILHSFSALVGHQRSKRIFGLCYVIVKVSLLSVVEIGVLPLMCGWWLDICSLSMFDGTLKDRETSFRLAPGTSMFIHWLFGMLYVYYFASFVILLREVVRPGVLWFLINLNDPDFSPLQEMIHTPIIHHIRRLVASSVIFGTAVLLMLWFPIRIIRYLWPSFLPYAMALQIEAQMNELSLELFLFQIILPALLEQPHTRAWMKDLIRLWCRSAAWLFGVHSYLLGDETDPNGNEEQAENNENEQGVFNGLGAVHQQALLPREGPIGVQPYQRPSWFYARLLGLLLAVCVSLVIASLAALTLPVWIGRKVMSLWLLGSQNSSGATIQISVAGGEATTRVHELYTAACGLYLCWLTVRAVTLLRSWLPQGRAAVLDIERLKQWCLLGAKSLIASSFLLGIIPLLFGLLLELVVVVPVRVASYQTPVLLVWQDWALGVLCTKIAWATIMIGPDWKIRRAVERVYLDGIRNMDLTFILYELAIPVTAVFSLALAVPYATAHSIVPLVISTVESKNFIARLLYPCLLLAFILSSLVAFQIRQFKKLYEHIKNDKYLVGKRLVNYDHRRDSNSNGF